MASEMEQVLRGVAMIAYGRNPSQIVERLRESGLLRLLEAGQAMRDWCDELRILLIKSGYSREREGIVDAWDAAKAAAMKEQAHA